MKFIPVCLLVQISEQFLLAQVADLCIAVTCITANCIMLFFF